MPESRSADGQFLSRRARREAERAAAAANAESPTTAWADTAHPDTAEQAADSQDAHTAPESVPGSSVPDSSVSDNSAPDGDDDLDEDDARANEVAPVAPRRAASTDPWKRPRRRREFRDGAEPAEPAAPEATEPAAPEYDDGRAPKAKSATELAKEPTFSSRAALKRYLREHGLDKPADDSPDAETATGEAAVDRSDDAAASEEALVAKEAAPDAVDADSPGTKASGLSETAVEPEPAKAEPKAKPAGKKPAGKKSGQPGGKKAGPKKQGGKNRPPQQKSAQQKPAQQKPAQQKQSQQRPARQNSIEAKDTAREQGTHAPDDDTAPNDAAPPEDRTAGRGKGAFGAPAEQEREPESAGDRQVPLPPGATRFPASAWATAKETDWRRGDEHKHVADTSSDKHSAADASAQGKPSRRPVIKPPATAQVSVVTGAMPLSDAGTTGALRPVAAPVAKSGARSGADFDDGSEVEDPPAPPLRASRAVNNDEPVLGRGGPSSTTLIVIGAAIVVAIALVVIGVLLVNG